MPIASAPPRHAPLAVLTQQRELRGLSVRGLAELAEVEHSRLWRIERGERPLTVDVLARLAAALELRELERLLGPWVVRRDG